MNGENVSAMRSVDEIKAYGMRLVTGSFPTEPVRHAHGETSGVNWLFSHKCVCVCVCVCVCLCVHFTCWLHAVGAPQYASPSPTETQTSPVLLWYFALTCTVFHACAPSVPSTICQNRDTWNFKASRRHLNKPTATSSVPSGIR